MRCGVGMFSQRRSIGTLQETLLRRSVDSVLDAHIDDALTLDLPRPRFEVPLHVRGCRLTQAELLEGCLPYELADPFLLVKKESAELSNNIKELLGSDHPVLSTVANYFFNVDGGKKMRPVLVLLFAKAAAFHRAQVGGEVEVEGEGKRKGEGESGVSEAQVRLAEITEMIHTASLLHDDVIDVADTRRGVKSVNQLFGNKLAILAGDFLLARSSVCMARLRNLEVVELLSMVIEHLVKGEVMQMKSDLKGKEAFEYYLRKNYYKTGSLIANSILAGVMLEDHSKEVQAIAFEYGQAVGQAFQLVDDALDFEGSFETTGKPSLADLKQGFATAPILFAQDDFPDMRTMIERKFSYPGDIDRAANYVEASGSISQTRDLAMRYVEDAIRAVKQLHPCPERDALVHLALKVVNRKA